MEPEQEAAAFWGSAENEVYPIDQRLKLALTALNFFGNEYEKLEKVTEELEAIWRESQSDTVIIRDAGVMQDCVERIRKVMGLPPAALG